MRAAFWVIAFFVCAWSFMSAQNVEGSPSSVQIKAGLILERDSDFSGKRYRLVRDSEENQRQVIWEARPSESNAPLVEGGARIAEWCSLVAADQASDGILVLLERNEFVIELLQFDGGGCLLFDLRTVDPGWLQALREGHRVTVSAPDRVHVHKYNEESQTFIFRGGKITDENGVPIGRNVFTVGGTVRREVKRPNPEEIRSGVLSKDPKTSKPGSSPNRKGERTSLWLAMTTLIAGIGGFLWFFYRKQRSQ